MRFQLVSLRFLFTIVKPFSLISNPSSNLPTLGSSPCLALIKFQGFFLKLTAEKTGAILFTNTESCSDYKDVMPAKRFKF